MEIQITTLFIQLALVLALASGIGYLVKRLKLPLMVAYLIVGLLFSLLQIFNSTTSEMLSLLPNFAVAFVLFFVGMELDIQDIKSLGKVISITSLLQIAISLSAGFLIATALGFHMKESFYLGTGLAFSSTIVVIKTLLERKELSSLYGKLSVGVLLIEDLVAILLLMSLTVGGSVSSFNLQNSFPLLILAIKGIFLLVLTVICTKYLLKKVFSAVARSPELLFLSALAWCFVLVAISALLGFSAAIGAFLAGVALANSPFHFEIQGKVKPLRDLFVTLFFVYLGSQVVFADLPTVLPLILLFTTYAIFVKPLLFLLILGACGFKKHTIFQTSLNFSQISEFSLIIMVMGLQAGVVSHAALTAVAFTGVLSIIVSSVLITYNRQIYTFLSPVINFFEHQGFVHQFESDKHAVSLEEHVVLVGGDQMGGKIINYLRREMIPFLVLDFNPEVIEKLMQLKIYSLYGDISDPEILEFLNLEKAKLLISTAPSLEDTLILLSELKKRQSQAIVIVRAVSVEDAKLLYKKGADFVILPELVTGEVVTQILSDHWPNMNYFKKRTEVELGKLARNQLAFT